MPRIDLRRSGLVEVKCVWMGGGTSKAAFLHAGSLPSDRDARSYAARGGTIVVSPKIFCRRWRNMPNIQVVIVDPRQLSLDALKLLLAGKTYDVIAATTSLEAALAEIERGARPRLLIVVLREPVEAFQSATLQRIRTIVPECKVVLVENTISSTLPARAKEWEVSALLRGRISRDVLTRSLALVMQGRSIFPEPPAMQPNDLDERARDSVELAKSRPIPCFSDLEARILPHLIAGHSNKMIAQELAIRDASIKIQMKGLLRKLKVHSRTQAALWAVANGFCEKTSTSRRTPVRSDDVEME
jgi:two-component system nitrate/nitrite response regulator NarL